MPPHLRSSAGCDSGPASAHNVQHCWPHKPVLQGAQEHCRLLWAAWLTCASKAARWAWQPSWTPCRTCLWGPAVLRRGWCACPLQSVSRRPSGRDARCARPHAAGPGAPEGVMPRHAACWAHQVRPALEVAGPHEAVRAVPLQHAQHAHGSVLDDHRLLLGAARLCVPPLGQDAAAMVRGSDGARCSPRKLLRSAGAAVQAGCRGRAELMQTQGWLCSLYPCSGAQHKRPAQPTRVPASAPAGGLRIWQSA